jgi:hypothetical protein
MNELTILSVSSAGIMNPSPTLAQSSTVEEFTWHLRTFDALVFFSHENETLFSKKYSFFPGMI